MTKLGSTFVSDDPDFRGTTGDKGDTGATGPAGPAGDAPLTTKGDMLTFDTADARLPVGTNGQVLEADSSESLGVKWAAPAVAPAFSGALVTHSLAQTVFGTAALAFDTETYDVGGWHDNATNNSRLTVPSGVTRVRLTGAMQDTTSVTGQFICSLSKNGVTIFVGASSGETESAGGDNAGWASPVLEVVAGDFFECEGFATTSRTTNADGRTYFSIEKVT